MVYFALDRLFVLYAFILLQQTHQCIFVVCLHIARRLFQGRQHFPIKDKPLNFLVLLLASVISLLTPLFGAHLIGPTNVLLIVKLGEIRFSRTSLLLSAFEIRLYLPPLNIF